MKNHMWPTLRGVTFSRNFYLRFLGRRSFTSLLLSDGVGGNVDRFLLRLPVTAAVVVGNGDPCFDETVDFISEDEDEKETDDGGAEERLFLGCAVKRSSEDATEDDLGVLEAVGDEVVDVMGWFAAVGIADG